MLMASRVVEEESKAEPPQVGETQQRVFGCGRRPGGHRTRIARAAWPLRGPVHPHTTEVPTIDGLCIDCGCSLLVPEAVPPGLRVILYGPVAPSRGVLLEEPAAGVVVDEADPPPAPEIPASRPARARRPYRATGRRKPGRPRKRQAEHREDGADPAAPEEGA
jgi:hypothetical protein